ncbi:MAG: JAB domain-containing protein [Geobacter sp.]|nr:JAB domain-containing protein [Geobacter sp.]
MPRKHQPAVSSDTPNTPASIPQLKVIFCGSVCESAPRYTSPLQVARLLSGEIRQLDREAFYVLHLNGKSQIISKELISLGSLNQSIVHPREVFKGALLNNSAAIMGVHNHPSGDPAPSVEDNVITKRLMECAALLGVNFLDHIIVGCTSAGIKYFSFLEAGRMCGGAAVSSPASVPAVRCNWLIDLRKQAGITQKQLAELAGLKHQAIISSMENGYQQITEDIEKSLKTLLQGVIDRKRLIAA